MSEEKAQQFMNELRDLFMKYQVFIDPYEDYDDHVVIDIIDKNEEVIIDNFDMNFDDYTFDGFYHLPNEHGLRRFICSDGDEND